MDLNDFNKKIEQKEENLYVNIVDPITKCNFKYTIHNKKTLWRANTLLTKEPVTINWIRNFKKNSVFFDVGANVGMYSIFSAITNQSKVFSFEPESNNFQILMENIVINNLSGYIKPYPIGISDFSELTTLFLSTFHKGASHHMLKESLDHNLKKKIAKIEQGIFSITLNDLIEKWNLPIPDYLKIDVDGIEFKIIDKSDLILKNPKLKSVLIEINSERDEDQEIIKILNKNKFIFDQKQVESALRKSGPHAGYAEYLFYR